jgi:predicted O-linked N-acetylglucosamine transferase (SPINDLY family)
MTELDRALDHHQAGRLKEAEALYREVLAREPEHPDALHLLGVIAHQSGEQDKAVTLIEQAIGVRPEVPEYYNNLGETYRALQQLDAALAAFRQALTLRPGYAEAHNNLGLTLQTQGKLAEAEAAYREALAIAPDVEVHCNLGNTLLMQGKPDKAIAAYQQAIALEPNVAEAHNNLGTALATQGKFNESVAALERAIALAPDYVDAYYNLGNTLHEAGKLAEAVVAYRRALERKPDYAEAYNNLGIALKDQGKVKEAIAAFEQAFALAPDYVDAYNNLGNSHQLQGRLTEAIAAYRKVLALAPDDADAYSNLGIALLAQGQLADAIATFKKAQALAPDDADAHSNLLLALNYDPDTNPGTLFSEHQRWADRHARPLLGTAPTLTNDPDPERRLRIGYLSPDFRSHSLAFFIEPLLTTHDRGSFEILCYANVTQPDQITEHLQRLGHTWRDIVRLRDEDVAVQIRQDHVDILVDLTGHTANNRLQVFARKPAPVQVAYLGYPNTRGFTAMDYWLSDAHADPPGQTERFYVEEIVRLPHGFNCYRPPADSPDVGDLPARATGHITFASFNNAAKVNARVIALWARILNALPEARLIMKARQLADSATKANFHRLFEQHGVTPERVEMISWVPSSTAHLALYNRIDIGLDCFPYNGHTTTCEALWMGVPVITLAGLTHAGRVGVSLLSQVGLGELIADTPEVYAELAVALARDLVRLETLRHSLRDRVTQSPLTDASTITRSFEAAYRQMWRRWCAKAPHA